MTMNKIIAIIICMFGIQTMNAQTTLSIGFLKSNKWMILEDGVEEGKKDTTFVSFDNKKMYTSTHYHNDFQTYEITRESDSEIVLTLRNFSHNYLDLIGFQPDGEMILKKKQ